MSRPSRRALLGTAGAIGAGAALGGAAPAAAAASGRLARRTERAPADETGAAYDTAPARAALTRLLPRHADQFQLVPLARGGGTDRFRVDGRAGRITVSGTTPAVLLTGVHWYLKYTCRAHVSWAGDQVELPGRLPAPASPAERSTALRHRFALNDTHDGYTAPYADWPHWERLIDVLALHGVNEVLVTPGAEAVYHRLLTDSGYSDAEARAWLPAPSHQPWWLLQNMSGYGGPLSRELIDKRAELGRRITGRLRELGMHPVLPGYFGTVPDGFAARNPGARTVPQGTWSGLKRPDWLDPRTDAFAAAAASFYRHQHQLLGPADHFKMDLLHEGGDPGDVPVPDAARAVEKALRTAHPDATWVILGWQGNPRRDLLDAVDHDRMLIVDGLSDLDTVTDRERDWGGVPYAFGSIPNFGGRTTLGAKTHIWAERFTAWRDKPGSKLAGTAYMPEAAERDPAAFELFCELAWRERPVDRAAWFDGYADLRYGARDDGARAAYAALRTSAYEISSKDGRPHDSVFAARPSLAARSGTVYATHTPAFDPAAFDTAFAALLTVRPALRGSDAYRHDLTDAARQALANRSWQLIGQLQEAYRRKDRTTFRALSELWLRLMRLCDEVTGAHRLFLLGPWLAQAKAMATGAEEQARLEHSARALLTTWADRATADGGSLANYANRDWHGLIREVHLPQWQAYLDELADALAADRPPKTFDWYSLEEPWTRARTAHPLRPTTDAYRTARRVHDTLAKAPYQGTVTVTADPSGLPPGGRATVTAALRNVNGLRATGRVDFALSGVDATASGPASLPSLPPGGTGRARWQVTAPAGPLNTPLHPLPYDLTVDYGPKGEPRVRAARHGTLYVAGPLDDDLRTVTTNAAVFGQLGDRLAVNGGGADLWKATAEFGAVYRPGALTAGGSVTVEVTSQDPTGPWARAGLVVRNRLAALSSPSAPSTPGAPSAADAADALGFLNLSVTPANGVVLSYDANGDGTLDTYRRLTGITAPVLLRLTRGKDAGAAGTYTGSCSTDDGATWREIATVTVPGAAARQDTGLHQCAANSATGDRGTAEFRRWKLA
ncbi:alpha-N-acetylglucosaminidase [Streptomyces sp. 2224.1]|uniref:alpha-N-acetylglucosaminidase n=1 Tax=unclassified Streptomyces TaxID=2593676 RepID=UPI00088CF39D|nr:MULTISPECIES: alpha-N-acetylglucosaminidase TIM-barrel domain-containing protein [unclassified Streptomyces]PBC82032.1 alpha-N-acetylglucosaminidase [Streptomyces sp. 2321.6]SDR51834.1 alpha-N-acetylglucosaminidase [Streptomyces sp. KS_16]SEC40769.1 alpha-N-acetylglucosaminidase [Streptomyces sp. 2133.1]SEC62825.1 alpha-N-acetylglucosaminidase [Streptomyces sp. 2224.1]SNC67238.1 alpha-N-acetylglucosaminidase [Streptomyces sp. 2114.4]